MVTSTNAANTGALVVTKKNPYGPTSVCTVMGKLVTANDCTPGTLVSLLEQVNGLIPSYFQISDYKNGGWIVNGPNNFVVTCSDPGAFGDAQSVNCTWEEM